MDGSTHWRTGTKHTQEARDKMSKAKRGKRHPKFKGYYLTPAGRYESTTQAATANQVSTKTVLYRCKSSTYKDKRWSFQPI